MNTPNYLLITVLGAPIAKARPRFVRRGKFVQTFNCQETEEGRFMLSVKSDLPDGWQPITGPIELKLRFVMPIPKSASQKQKIEMAGGVIMHTKKPDTDNLVKFVKDCLNGLAWSDDSQVWKIEAHKEYGDIPHVQIEIRWR